LLEVRDCKEKPEMEIYKAFFGCEFWRLRTHIEYLLVLVFPRGLLSVPAIKSFIKMLIKIKVKSTIIKL
jgi:hypothetical protein